MNNPKAPVGYCHAHPRTPAMVRYKGPETGHKKKGFCRDCWAKFYKGKKTKEV